MRARFLFYFYIRKIIDQSIDFDESILFIIIIIILLFFNSKNFPSKLTLIIPIHFYSWESFFFILTHLTDSLIIDKFFVVVFFFDSD